MPSKLELDPRIDPRIKAALAGIDLGVRKPDVSSREELLAQELSPAGRAGQAAVDALFDTLDSETIAPSEGLTVRTETVVSDPDGNTIKVLFIRPEGDDVVPCVYYIHGGRMAFSSAFLGNYRCWGRMLAHQGVAVAMVDFRNSVHASSTPDIGPYPAGLDDCASGLRWIHSEAERLGVDRARIIVAGESGGGNLALALGMKLTREGDSGLVRGLYAMCPYIAGEWPLPQNPSSVENDGIFIFVHDNRSTMAYGIDAFQARDPLAWPGMAGEGDVRGLPPTVISVNECDPLRDEGIGFYRLLLSAGVPARCRQVMGTVHGTEILPTFCPDISRSTAVDIADFARAAGEHRPG